MKIPQNMHRQEIYEWATANSCQSRRGTKEKNLRKNMKIACESCYLDVIKGAQYRTVYCCMDKPDSSSLSLSCIGCFLLCWTSWNKIRVQVHVLNNKIIYNIFIFATSIHYPSFDATLVLFLYNSRPRCLFLKITFLVTM